MLKPKNHNFQNKPHSKCKYCNKSYLQLVDKKGMVGQCAIGKDKDLELQEDALILVKALRILKNDKT